jgi:glyoxylase-like metal-dependent hydrolase (beta-lactamase superfamily II)
MRVLLIPAHNPSPMTGAGNNTWLIDGAEPALIDAGVGEAAHVDAIARALGRRSLARVIVTHGHADHASGVPALRARWPDLDACKWPHEADVGAWRRLDDGARVRVGDGELVVVHTPGHAPDHVCLLHEATRDLYAGDMLTQGTTVVIPAGRGGSLRSYLASLARLKALAPARILPGHGPIIDRPIELIDQYVEHRRMRDAQVRACLAEGITDPDAIVAHIYPGLSAALRPAARATVMAHLEMCDVVM